MTINVIEPVADFAPVNERGGQLAMLEGFAEEHLQERRERLAATEMKELDLFSVRPTLSEHHVSQLRTALAISGDLEPVLVLRRGGQVFLIDGRHRVAAYAASGRAKSVPVAYFEGSPREAVIEAWTVNSKPTLTLDNQQRQDGGWELVKLGSFTSKEIERAVGISKAQVTIMRRAFRTLGTEAYEIAGWWRARRAAFDGGGGIPNDIDEEEWLNEQAQAHADKMAKAFSTKLAANPELMARTLEVYMGRNLLQLVRDLRGLTYELEDDLEDDDIPF
ncbi:ParB/RepB/Spo0J family partition protein [Aurantimonas sp. MSK8Z-1]|uniref:ParB/RepB/Spo0J family partition protein n=1 Tax=Mangrovibrevibacter kandeliae TaxID=2968473 RepID=UPI002119A121|nr:ParB/RepB/Spo0J family partition protein [Aurantimonas sp. MSK8Z-1]MCW4117058.1 ParB/RepB/Spo0J family partition protein [Aurantimonas sp. MSK8Z-1]